MSVHRARQERTARGQSDAIDPKRTLIGALANSTVDRLPTSSLRNSATCIPLQSASCLRRTSLRHSTVNAFDATDGKPWIEAQVPFSPRLGPRPASQEARAQQRTRNAGVDSSGWLRFLEQTRRRLQRRQRSPAWQSLPYSSIERRRYREGTAVCFIDVGLSICSATHSFRRRPASRERQPNCGPGPRLARTLRCLGLRRFVQISTTAKVK